MFGIELMSPALVWVGVPAAIVILALVAVYNLRMLSSTRRHWGDQIVLDHFTPRTKANGRNLWILWIAFACMLVASLAGPNISNKPEMVPAGSVQTVFLFDVSPSMAAEDYRSFLPVAEGTRAPDASVQWGTRLDAAKHFVRQDLMPQLANNEAGIVTVMGAGFNMWDLTRDLGEHGAFRHVLEDFVEMGAAPGGGADFTSGLATALAEFKLIDELRAKEGDDSERVKFIVFFTDGGFTGDINALDEVLAELNKQNVRLLIVGLGGSTPVTVPKYDEKTGRRNGEFYKGDTAVDTKVLYRMRDAVGGAEVVLAPPGTEHIEYSFPSKSGGLYATPARSNLKPWLLALAVALFVIITAGGGGSPRWRLLILDLHKFAAGGFAARIREFRSRNSGPPAN